MSFTIKIDKQKRVIVSTFAGAFTPDVILQGRKLLKDDPAFDPSFAHVLDLSRVAKVEMPGPAMERLARDRSIFEKTSVQVIVAPERLKFEFAKLFRSKSSKERPSLHVTRTLEAAYALIALSHSSMKA